MKANNEAVRRIKQMKSFPEYNKYIKEHIVNVKQVWDDLQPLLKDKYWLGSFIKKETEELIAVHDESKYSEEEFAGYAQFFYPEKGKEKNKSDFAYAWNHHQKTNPHHWQYWLMWKKGETVALEMPFAYVIEMLCDWTAMSYKFGDTPQAFYDKTKNEMLLNNRTKSVAEEWLMLFTKLAEEKKRSSN